MSVLTQQLVCFFTVTLVGLQAGVMLGAAMVQQTAQHLDAECWTARQNGADRLFGKVMPTALLLAILSPLAAVLVFHDAARIWMGMSCLASMLVLAITLIFEVPLNKRFARWQPGSIPGEWQLWRDAWLRHHWRRTVCGIAAFLFSTAACSMR